LVLGDPAWSAKRMGTRSTSTSAFIRCQRSASPILHICRHLGKLDAATARGLYGRNHSSRKRLHRCDGVRLGWTFSTLTHGDRLCWERARPPSQRLRALSRTRKEHGVAWCRTFYRELHRLSARCDSPVALGCRLATGLPRAGVSRGGDEVWGHRGLHAWPIVRQAKTCAAAQSRQDVDGSVGSHDWRDGGVGGVVSIREPDVHQAGSIPVCLVLVRPVRRGDRCGRSDRRPRGIAHQARCRRERRSRTHSRFRRAARCAGQHTLRRTGRVHPVARAAACTAVKCLGR
jgi:hypothetical protein